MSLGGSVSRFFAGGSLAQHVNGRPVDSSGSFESVSQGERPEAGFLSVQNLDRLNYIGGAMVVAIAVFVYFKLKK